jgi:hypothetical protein
MTDPNALKDSLVDGALTGLGVAVLAKGHDIAMANKRQFGSYLKMDGDVIRSCLTRNVRGTILTAVVTGVVFVGCSWASKVMSEKNQQIPTESSRGR